MICETPEKPKCKCARKDIEYKENNIQRAKESTWQAIKEFRDFCGHWPSCKALRVDTIPPPFAIKASDKCACAIVRAWIVIARSIGVNEAKLLQAELHLSLMRHWQEQHRGEIKIPD